MAAGERVHVELRVDPPPPLERVPFAGTLELSAEWGLADFALAFEREERGPDGKRIRFRRRSRDMRAGEQLWHWIAPASPPGRYEVELAELAFAVSLELPERGTTSARIVVPPPCEVAVRCVDAETGAALGGIELVWSADCPDAPGRRTRPARWDEASARWRFRAPLGRILLTAYSETHEVAPSLHTLHPGHNELELRLARLCGLVPTLACEGTPIPWSEGPLPELEPLEGQAPPQASWFLGSSSMGLTFRDCEPGRYRLVLPPIDGYEPVGEELVRLERGRVLEHVVELRRAPR